MNKPSPLLKNWLKIGSVAFGVSCGLTLPFTQNLAQSALIGLATVPGMAASVVVRSRQRRQQVNRQLERGKLRLQELQHRGAILARQLEIGRKDRQEIETRVAQLQSLAVNLNDRLDRDLDRQQQLERQLAMLSIYFQEQQNIATNLDRKIQAKQALLLEVDADLSIRKLASSQVQSAQISLETTNDRSPIELITKQELELQIQQLQNRVIVEHEELDRSISEKRAVIATLDLTISNREQDREDTELEVARLTDLIVAKVPELASQEQKLADLNLQLSETELAWQSKQVQLDALAGSEISMEKIQNESLDLLSDSRLQRELKIAQLELSSRQAELDNLELKIHARSTSIATTDPDNYLQTLEPQPPTVARKIEPISTTDGWYDKFIDNPHLTVLKHIEKHGTITEAEASSKLGNARSVRQFANKLEEYAANLPFSIGVESSPKGNRYIKLIDN